MSKALDRGFERVGITKKSSFNTLIENLENSQKISEDIKKELRRKIFVLLNRSNAKKKNKSTSPLTSMITGGKISLLLSMKDTPIVDIKYIASHERFSSISSMCNGRGIPTKEEIESFFKAIQELGKEEFIASISSMCNGRGIPEEKEIKAFFNVMKKLGKEEFIASISSMCNGKGIPEEKEVTNFFKAIQDLDYRGKMTTLATYFASQGLPSKKSILRFIIQEQK